MKGLDVYVCVCVCEGGGDGVMCRGVEDRGGHSLLPSRSFKLDQKLWDFF